MENTNYNLNAGQKLAGDAFFDFLFDPTKKSFILSGPAGVGKTFWMGYIIDMIMPRYEEICKLMGITPEYVNVSMTATTNKAAEVLEAATGRNTQTIHSFLNLTLHEDWETGKMKLTQNPRTWQVHEHIILFVDECSMVDKNLKRYLDEGTFKCKIVYVGDKDQLAPVTETLSPIYTEGSPIYELTEQMRTAVPELQNLNQQLRETVQTGEFKPVQIVPGIIDLLDDIQMQQQLDITFSQQTINSRVLAYTNKQVIAYNDYIRNRIRKLPAAFGPGEILVNATAIKIGRKGMMSVESEVEIRANHGSGQVAIDSNVNLDVDYCDVTSHLGERFDRIPVPTNRKHFNDLVAYYKRIKNWERFYYLKQNFPDFRPRDAATVHKAQGSTYDTVFVDLGNISTCHQADQVARMLYVAFSRARSRVFLYGELAPKYGGLIEA